MRPFWRLAVIPLHTSTGFPCDSGASQPGPGLPANPVLLSLVGMSRISSASDIVQEILALGHLPRETVGRDDAREHNLAMMLRRARKAGWITDQQEEQLQALPTPVDALVQDILALGHQPRQRSGDAAEVTLYKKLRRARQSGALTDQQEEQIKTLPVAAAVELMRSIRTLGRLPRKQNSPEESQLWWRLKRGRTGGILTEEHLRELDAMTAEVLGRLPETDALPDPRDPFSEAAANRLEQDLLMMANGLRTKAVKARCARYRRYVSEPALRDDPVVLKYKDEVARVMAAPAGKLSYVAGRDIRGDELRQFSEEPKMTAPIVCQLCDCDFVSDGEFHRHVEADHTSMDEYRKRVIYLLEMQGPRALTAQEKRVIVQNYAHFQQFSRPGTGGNTFTTGVKDVPRCETACGVCQRKDFIEHRYRLNLFGDIPEGRVTVDTAQKPADAEEAAPRGNLVKHDGVYYIQNVDAVHELLDVERYAKRWPLIPREDLHASSVQHPRDPGRRWLLHVRRVPCRASAPGDAAGTPAVPPPPAPPSGVDPRRRLRGKTACPRQVANTSGASQPGSRDTRGAGASQPGITGVGASQPDMPCGPRTDRPFSAAPSIPCVGASQPGTTGVGASQPGEPAGADRPSCAGVGDPRGFTWACWDCVSDLGAAKPKMPVFACANDNWIGRERDCARTASRATKMLASLGRCCWQQIRLGRQKDPAVQETALVGNTIFFAQPTADVPCMELPPPQDALLDTLNVVFTRTTTDLSKAEWAVVDRASYMDLVRQRAKECPVFAHVRIREDIADTRLPERGVPEHILACAVEVEGAQHAPARLDGPAARAPERGRHDEAGDESDDVDDEAEGEGIVRAAAEEDVPEDAIAVDPAQDVGPVKKLRALQVRIEQLQEHARTVAANERAAMVEGADGALQPVVDEGGRDVVRTMVLDLQNTAGSIGEAERIQAEQAVAESDVRLTVSPEALAIPTEGPLDSFGPRAWPACYVEWWFGDGAPGLSRDRPMLFEQVARRLVDIEEHEYALPSDTQVYRASRQSRFNRPEIIAVMGDVVRRLRLLRGVRVAVGRKGFTADLKAIASATSDDFMAALNIVGPKETMGQASSRPELPAKVKTALRTLLLSTSDVPGTEGRKKKLRHNGHGNNLLFGAPSFFATPNFADTYHPLVHMLHYGGASLHAVPGGASQPAAAASVDSGASQPAVLGVDSAASQRAGADGHDEDAGQPASSGTRRPLQGYMSSAEPSMPSLRKMHEIVASDPRAQAKFFLLMSELHYRYLIGVDSLHIGRTTLARPWPPRQDELAATLQPCISPGTTDVQAPLEAQGRGFTHGHGKGHSVLGATLRWLRRGIAGGLEKAVKTLREGLLRAAATTQYDSARETGRQMQVDVPKEPFTLRQQRQSRMDGGAEDDGTLRQYVQVAPALEQPHKERERCRAAAESRMPLAGAAVYRDLPLTGAFQSVFPAYRQRATFGLLGDVALLTSQEDAQRGVAAQAVHTRPLDTVFGLAEDGSVEQVYKADGNAASVDDLRSDARAWAAHFAHDSFHNHVTNHEHDCTATCIKYAKKKLGEKEALRSHKVPSCRFWFFHVVTIGKKRRRRRGKPLVPNPFVAEDDHRNQQFRCQVCREQPFRGTSNDVAQVCSRCNVDYQFLSCAPAWPEGDPGGACQSAASGASQPVVGLADVQGGASQPAGSSASQAVVEPLDSTGGDSQPARCVEAAENAPPKRRRISGKTTPLRTGAQRPVKTNGSAAAWLPGVVLNTPRERACVRLIQSSFAKAAGMDFYITKYQGKPMEALTPLFKCMTEGVHRLETQEAAEEAEAKARAEAEASPDAPVAGPVATRRKTQEDLAKRARRLTCRLASMGNRCFWLSAAEVTVHLLTDGDCLQTHTNVSIFTRQLQWAMHQCKRVLNGDPLEERVDPEHLAIQTVSVRVAPEQDEENADPNDAQDEAVHANTTSTNASDDYAHRGDVLAPMPYYVYRMYVRFLGRISRSTPLSPRVDLCFLLDPG